MTAQMVCQKLNVQVFSWLYTITRFSRVISHNVLSKLDFETPHNDFPANRNINRPTNSLFLRLEFIFSNRSYTVLKSNQDLLLESVSSLQILSYLLHIRWDCLLINIAVRIGRHKNSHRTKFFHCLHWSVMQDAFNCTPVWTGIVMLTIRKRVDDFFWLKMYIILWLLNWCSFYRSLFCWLFRRSTEF